MNGETVNWSFLVKGPAYKSNRKEPELVMNNAGLGASLLLSVSAKGMT